MGINITLNPESCLWAGGRPGRSVVIVNEFGIPIIGDVSYIGRDK